MQSKQNMNDWFPKSQAVIEWVRHLSLRKDQKMESQICWSLWCKTTSRCSPADCYAELCYCKFQGCWSFYPVSELYLPWDMSLQLQSYFNHTIKDEKMFSLWFWQWIEKFTSIVAYVVGFQGFLISELDVWSQKVHWWRHRDWWPKVCI